MAAQTRQFLKMKRMTPKQPFVWIDCTFASLNQHQRAWLRAQYEQIIEWDGYMHGSYLRDQKEKFATPNELVAADHYKRDELGFLVLQDN